MEGLAAQTSDADHIGKVEHMLTDVAHCPFIDYLTSVSFEVRRTVPDEDTPLDPTVLFQPCTRSLVDTQIVSRLVACRLAIYATIL